MKSAREKIEAEKWSHAECPYATYVDTCDAYNAGLEFALSVLPKPKRSKNPGVHEVKALQEHFAKPKKKKAKR